MTSPRQLLAKRYRELLEEIYQSCADATPELPLELQLQEWWAAGLLPHQGTTQDGKTLNILDKGRWNRCPGPDFTHAEIELNGVRLRGDIELDPRAQDWEAHGHGANPAFDQVVLQVVFTPPPAGWYTRTSQHKEVPILYIAPDAWQTATHGTTGSNDAPLPRCRQPLAEMNAASIRHLLQAAAAHRQEQKRRRFCQRVNAAGKPQAWYEAWATTLGYSANKDAMRHLAMRAPIKTLGKNAEAILLGTAGFLFPVLPEQTPEDARAYHRSVWDAWWLLREEFELAPGRELQWNKAPARPLNHPQRRVAALAVSARKWERLLPLMRAESASELKTILSSLSHPFWDIHYTLSSAPMSRKAHLIGEQRIQDFLINHVLAYDESPAAWSHYLAVKSSAVPPEIKRVAHLLFGDRTDMDQELKKAYVQQALLQIDTDFCASNICMDCAFPAQLCQWAH